MMWEPRKLRGKKQRLLAARQRIEERSYGAALPLLRDAFLLDHLKSDPRLIERVQDHHLSILQELLSISKEHRLQLSNLPLIEELLSSRAAAMKAYSETRVAARALARRRRSASRPPAWAVSEFARKLGDLQDKINATGRALRIELDKLFRKSADSGDSPREVVYH